MTDEQKPTPGQDPPENETPNQDDSPGKDPPKPVPYADFKKKNDQVRDLEAKLAKLEKAEKARQEQETAAQGRFKELAEKAQRERDAVTLENLRLRTAARKGLPAELIDRLKGTTAEELEADADALLKLVKASGTGSPGVPPPSGGSAPEKVDFSKMTPAEIRKWADEHTKGTWGV